MPKHQSNSSVVEGRPTDLRQPQPTLRLLRLLLLFLVSSVTELACIGEPPDLGGGLSTTDGGGEDGSSTGADSTGGADDESSSGGEPADPCDYESGFGFYPAAIEHAGTMSVSSVCNYPELVSSDPQDLTRLTAGSLFDVYVYYPDSGSETWALGEEERPVAFLAPGNGHQLVLGTAVSESPTDHTYYEIANELVGSGFVVIGVDLPALAPSARREKAIACTMVWARTLGTGADGWARANENRIGDGVAVVGHSRGGAGAFLLTDDWSDFAAAVPTFNETELCATVAIAPRWGPEILTPTDPDPPVDIRIEEEAATVPYFTILGGRDRDVTGEGISQYDSIAPEDNFDANQDSQLPGVHDRTLWWVHGVGHNQWGGVDPTTLPPGGLAIATEVGPWFVERGLRWAMFDWADARSDLLVPTDPGATSSDYPPNISDQALWNAIQGWGELQRPVIMANYAQADDALGGDRLLLETFDRGVQQSAVCGGSDSGFLSPSTVGGAVTVTGLDLGETCHGPSDLLLQDSVQIGSDIGSFAYNRHQTNALRVSWGGQLPDGEITFALRDGDAPLVDLSEYSYIGIRVANLAAIVESELFAPDCSSILPDTFTLELELATTNPDDDISTAVVSTSVVVEPEIASLPSGSGGNGCDSQFSQVMYTFRVPLSEFCAQEPLALQNPLSLTVRFPADASVEHWAMLDSIELVRDPDDPASAACGSVGADWRCEVAAGFAAFREVCSGEPTPKCEETDTSFESIDAPHVYGPPGTGFDGWLVHAPVGWVLDANNPSAGELAWISDACQKACELEWSDDPDVQANCSSSYAFETPSLHGVTDLAPQHHIPASQASGEQVFPPQVLSCDLEDDCCLYFDEHACAAKQIRGTSLMSPLERAEEQRLQLGGGGTKIEFITQSATYPMAATGEIGYSLCPDGETGVTCPFYLGSFSVTGTHPVTVVDTCPDASTLTVTVTDFDVQLLQPSLGIADSGSYMKGFPSGALLLQANATVDGNEYVFRGTNQSNVEFFAASYGLFAVDLDATFPVPCGDSVTDLTVRFDLRTNAQLEEPPYVELNLPEEVSCPGTLTLAATVFDGDGDLDRVKWYVDDVAIANGVSAIPMTTDHSVRAVAFDSRGAATTDEVDVTCR